MTNYAEQFTGTPLVAGEVFGVRAWDVDTLGRIKSPSYKHIWTPDENVAECQKQEQTLTTHYESDELPKGARITDVCINWFTPPTFDALYRSDYLFYSPPSRENGTYQVTFELPDGSISSQTVKQIREVQVKPPKPKKHDFTTCTCGFHAYLSGTNGYADRNVIGVVQGYGETFLGTRGFRSSKARIVAAYASAHADVERVRPLPVSLERMKQLYPAVAWFDDYAAMVSEFPPSDPEPTPDNDTDFWTRSA